VKRRAQYLSSRYLYYGIFQHWRQPMRVAARRELLANLERSPAEIEEIQRQKLVRLVHHAYEHTPYYRRLFQELGLQPSAIQEAGDLTKIPLLAKRDIQENREDLIARSMPEGQGATRLVPTGGSTGDPFQYVQDDRSWSISIASIERGYDLAGWTPGDPAAIVWGRPLDRSKKKALKYRLVDAGINQLFLDSYGMSRQDMARYARELRSFQPRLLVGFSASLIALVHLMRDEGIGGIKPNAIVTTAETLFPTQRALLEEFFDCPVFDRYGTTEAATAAHECIAHRGYHLFTDLHVVEFLTDDGKPVSGSPGHIAVTNLDNYAMPLLRYMVGDVGTLSEKRCSCGLPFPVMSTLEGRATDLVTTPSGRIIHGLLLNRLMAGVPGVRRFQAIQETPGELTILVVPGPEFEPTALPSVEAAIHENIDPQLRVHAMVVENIEHGASGKHRYIVSKVPAHLTGE